MRNEAEQLDEQKGRQSDPSQVSFQVLHTSVLPRAQKIKENETKRQKKAGGSERGFFHVELPP